MNFRTIPLSLLCGLCLFSPRIMHAQESAEEKISRYADRMTLFQKIDKDSMRYYLGLIEAIARETGNPAHMGRYMIGKGVYHGALAERDSALFYERKALAFYQDVQDTAMLGVVYNNLGQRFAEMGQYDSALNSYFTGISYSSVSDSSIMALSLLNIGDTYSQMGKPEDAIVKMREGLQVARDLDNKYLQALGSSLLGQYIMFQNPRAAITLVKRFLPTDPYAQRGISLHANYIILGASYFFLQKYDSALYYYEVSRVISRQNRVLPDYLTSLVNMGEAMGYAGKFQAGLDTLRKAQDLGRRAEMPRFVKDALQYESTLFEQWGKPEQALQAYKRYSTYDDSLLNLKVLSNINELETRYQTAEQQREIAEQDLEISNQQNQILGLVGGLFIVALLGIVAYVWTRSRAKARVQEAVIEEQDKGIAAIFTAIENERKRIARDLHDGVGQQLSALKMGFQELKEGFSDDDQRQRAEKLQGLIDDTAQDTRSISHQMMPRTLTELGLVPAIGDSLEKSLGNTSIAFEFEHFNLQERYEERVEIAVYRILQELVNNLIKHSGASKAVIQLFQADKNLILLVEDNGQGMPLEKKEGLGWLTIKNRLNTFRGNAHFEPGPEAGTTATITIPLAS